jgi:hypothetical protein
MQTGFRRGSNRQAVWFINRYLLLSVSALLLAHTASAQEITPLSPSVVLVLKLVSTTHVKPTTGIVVSDHGLVLVPADFVLNEGEIVVLDGGTDIVRNGRSAKVVQRSIAGGLALLSVEGLNRPGFILSESALNGESELHLAAFPPAEYIAKGAEPLWVPVNFLQAESSGPSSLAPETPLPYVTGPIIDACGYLAGLSLSTGAQSLEPGKIPVIIFSDEIKRILDSMQINLAVANCAKPVQQPLNTQDKNSAALKTSAAKEPALQASESEAVTGAPVITETQQPVGKQSPAATDLATRVVSAKPTTVKTPDPASIWHSLPFWLALIGIIILLVLIWKGYWLFRLGKIKIEPTTAARAASSSQPASDEPDTTQLQAGSDTASGKPRSAPLDEADIPDMNNLPQACNGLLVIEGLLDAVTPFRRFCAVNTQQINIVIGRGEADISIEHPTISRVHARLESAAGLMTLSDLRSSNGTYIRAIPCLPGEVMFVVAADEIFMGDVRFRIRVITKEAELS